MFNKVYLLGRISKEPELRATTSGKAVCSTSIATSKTWKDEAGNKQEKTEFTNLVIWKGAEVFAQYLSKGSKVFIEGELSTRDWLDKDTNKKRYATEVIVKEFFFLDDKKSFDNANQAKENNNVIETKEGEEIRIEDIPF